LRSCQSVAARAGRRCRSGLDVPDGGVARIEVSALPDGFDPGAITDRASTDNEPQEVGQRSRHPLEAEPAVGAGPANEAITQMIDAGLLDEVAKS
jgi:hypothetical protein